MLRNIVLLGIFMSIIETEISGLTLPGDFSVGALFNIHEPPKQSDLSFECGRIQPYGMQRLQAAIFALEQINRDPKILPNVKLGMDIRDTCGSETLALSKALSLVGGTAFGKMSHNSEHARRRQPIEFATRFQLLTPSDSSVIGIIGPGSSEESIGVQKLLKLFDIPEVAYSDTSMIFRDKIKYPTFMRIMPCESWQPKIVHDILRHFNWTYVSVVRNAGSLKQEVTKFFRNLIHSIPNGSAICIANEVIMESHYNETESNRVIQELNKDKSMSVVICFCEEKELRLLLEATKRLNLTNRFTFIVSDIWANQYEIPRDLEEQAWGMIHIRIQSPDIPNFSSYYKSLTPSNNHDNMWFLEFWEDKFNCTWPADKSFIRGSTKYCTGNESLAEDYNECRSLGFVIKSVWAMAHGLHNMMTEVCDVNYSHECIMKMYPFNTSAFLNHMKNLSFMYEDELVINDMTSHSEARYNIQNFQKLPNNKFKFVNIATWSNKSLKMWNDYQNREYKLMTSICSTPCPRGYHKVFGRDSKNTECCWDCKRCDDYDYVSSDKEQCLPCSVDERPNANRTACDKIPISERDWSDPIIIMTTSFVITGLIITSFTFYIFIKYKDTPVVKASSGQLCYIILFSMILAHVAVFTILAPPTAFTCSLSRTLPGIAITMMSAGLYTKTNRIARILARSKKRFPRKKYRLMSTSSQIAITFFCVAIETAICFTMLTINSPVPRLLHRTREHLSYVCSVTHMDVILPCLLIMFLHGLCILSGFKTRNIPGNFNESQFIAFSMLLNCIMWVVFFPIFFKTNFKAITAAMFLTLNASFTLIFLFFPKLYIIIFKPEKNNRALFITNKSIRTHIGSTAEGNTAMPTKRSIDISSEIYDEALGNRCGLRRSVAIQTSSKLLQKVAILYNERVTPSMEQDYSSSDDDYSESISDNCDNINIQHNNVNTLNQYDTNIVTKFNMNNNDKRKINLPSKNVRGLLGKFFSVPEVIRDLKSKDKSPTSSSLEPWVEQDVNHLPQSGIDGRTISSQKVNLKLDVNKNVPKEKMKRVTEQEERTRIDEKSSHTHRNSDPIFNITITPGSGLPGILNT